MSSLTAAYWVNVATWIVAEGAAVTLLVLNQYTDGITIAKRRGRARILAALSLLYLALLFVNAAFLMGQGSFLRTDAVDAMYARWIGYAVACGCLAFVLAEWFWHMKLLLGLAVVLAVLGHTLNVFATLSTSPNHWIWFALSFVFFVPLFLVVAFLKRRRTPFWLVLIAIVTVAVVGIVYSIIMGLGHALGAVLSLELETWLYYIIDVMTKLVVPFILYFFYCPLPCTLLETPELDCQAYKTSPRCGRCGWCTGRPPLMARLWGFTQDFTRGVDCNNVGAGVTGDEGFIQQDHYTDPNAERNLEQQQLQQQQLQYLSPNQVNQAYMASDEKLY